MKKIFLIFVFVITCTLGCKKDEIELVPPKYKAIGLLQFQLLRAASPMKVKIEGDGKLKFTYQYEEYGKVAIEPIGKKGWVVSKVKGETYIQILIDKKTIIPNTLHTLHFQVYDQDKPVSVIQKDGLRIVPKVNSIRFSLNERSEITYLAIKDWSNTHIFSEKFMFTLSFVYNNTGVYSELFNPEKMRSYYKKRYDSWEDGEEHY